MSSQSLSGTARPDSSQIVHKVQIRYQHGELQRIQALIDCGASSICISPELLNRLGLPHEAAHITTHDLDGQVTTHARELRKTTMTILYMDHLALVDDPEVIVVEIRAYDLVLGLRWFKSRKREIDWATS